MVLLELVLSPELAWTLSNIFQVKGFLAILHQIIALERPPDSDAPISMFDECRELAKKLLDTWVNDETPTTCPYSAPLVPLDNQF